MPVAMLKRARRAVVLGTTLALCGGVAVGLAKSSDIQFELGYAYENGNFHGWSPGFSQDDRKATYWLGRAARGNHPRAQYMLGTHYAHGFGVPQDGARAVEWFSRSAQNGYAPACYHLGWMYHKGDGVPRDDDRAIRLLEQAASQGMAAAQFALGSFYERADGVPADTSQALKWYALAAHFARSQPDSFDNAAFAERAQAACEALASRLAPSSEGKVCQPAAD
jgi:TPR repeat protein